MQDELEGPLGNASWGTPRAAAAGPAPMLFGQMPWGWAPGWDGLLSTSEVDRSPLRLWYTPPCQGQGFPFANADPSSGMEVQGMAGQG